MNLKGISVYQRLLLNFLSIIIIMSYYSTKIDHFSCLTTIKHANKLLNLILNRVFKNILTIYNDIIYIRIQKNLGVLAYSDFKIQNYKNEFKNSKIKNIPDI